MRHRHVVCAIAKDEDCYISEWVSYHLAIGFEHIYLYDNESKNPVEDVIAGENYRHQVTCTRWPTIVDRSAQVDAYRHFLATYGGDAEWVAVIDLDEFINIKVDSSIAQFTARFGDAMAIAINWRIFGSSGLRDYHAAPMTERFRYAAELEFPGNSLRKTIHRLASVTEIDIHNGRYAADPVIRSPDGSIVDNGTTIPIAHSNYSIAQINHYFVKSYDEWLLKIKRGYTDATVRPVEMFDVYDRNEFLDESILAKTQT